jgi:hypothetical protein
MIKLHSPFETFYLFVIEIIHDFDCNSKKNQPISFKLVLSWFLATMITLIITKLFPLNDELLRPSVAHNAHKS